VSAKDHAQKKNTLKSWMVSTPVGGMEAYQHAELFGQNGAEINIQDDKIWCRCEEYTRYVTCLLADCGS